MSNFLCTVNFNDIETQNLVLQSLATDPANVEAKIYYNTTSNTIRFFDGTAWRDVGSETVTSFQNIVAGHKIADFTNEDGVVVDLNETITSFDVSVLGEVSYTDESGVSATFTETPLVVTTDGTPTGVSLSGTSNHVLDIRLLSGLPNNAITLAADGGLYLDVKEQDVVADIAARDSLTGLQSGNTAYVVDASTDPTVDTGSALYVYDGTAWQKIAEFESVESYKSEITLTGPLGTLAGRTIAVHDDGDASTATDIIQESVTTLVDTDGTVVYTNELNQTTTFSYVRKFCQDITTSAGTAMTLTHNLNTADVQVTLMEGNNVVNACVETVDVNNISVTTNGTHALRVCVLG